MCYKITLPSDIYINCCSRYKTEPIQSLNMVNLPREVFLIYNLIHIKYIKKLYKVIGNFTKCIFI